ncbi:galactokinase [Bifidobacterium sp. B4081]|uniref:galactokinase n=1 Tax=unclassified Bifidobacterium TaxID=2608897 RepID=UPI00226ABE72|nr:MULTISPECIES: galactokinase [unclassified Bifidobacterium]MCX8644878.1 galactokinase [Bifidobacterium sp. B4077]MCX8646692.1 galactokinase [Bifidobacterium sp. B4081]MCX8668477.1 galactokinase [Bifidobacterium sp. B3998]
MTTRVEFMQAWTQGAHGQGATKARELFQKVYGEDPQGVWSAPGRINLIGEHTDYNAGLCLPIALPTRTYVAVSPRTDSRVRLVSTMDPEHPVQADLDGLQARGVSGWAAYPVGVAWALQRDGFLGVRGFDLALASCVPVGSGLSSSAAMTCAVALALDDLFGLGLGGDEAGRVRLIQAAITAENDMAGASTGGMDQSAAMRCRTGCALRLDCRPELDAMSNVHQVPFDLQAAGLELLVVDTRAQHQLNDGQYDQRRATCEQAAHLLGVANLRQAADQVNGAADPPSALAVLLEQLPEETMRRRVRHVVSEIGRVDRFIEAFGRGDYVLAGRLFNASHDSLRDDYEVTCPELDEAVDAARQGGAYGARMTGGGFGGSIIALADAGKGSDLARDIAERFASKGFKAPRALIALPSSAAARES